MMFFHFILFVGIILPSVSGHAYFVYPTPRIVYCANDSCVTAGTLGRQGALWGLPANRTLDDVSPITQTTCNGSVLITNASIGASYDPGFNGKTSASWQAGSLQTLQIFISELHPIENRTVYPTDGWQIRYRDGTQPNSTFTPIPFTYVNVIDEATIGPVPASGFKLGHIVLATITVPEDATTDGIFQFFWRNNQGRYNGTMWLSCVDVTITSDASLNTVLSIFSIIFAVFCLISVQY